VTTTTGTTPDAVPAPEAHSLESRFVDVDDVRTHYIEGGTGTPVVLLHSGEFGSCADLSWEYNLAHLARSHRVIAPDWLGFGQTSKIHDFENSLARRMRHMQRFFEVVGVESAHLVGNSMGATLLLRDAASDKPVFPARSIVAISGGGFIPDNEARHALLGYDCSVDSMERVLQALFPRSVWSRDRAYLARRHQESLRPGAWECSAAARFKSPAVAPRTDYGGEDTTAYERITVPTLLITGDDDVLKLPGYGRELVARMPRGELLEVADAGHCAHIEQAAVVNAAMSTFFDAVDRQ
jgi:pimeloyl-ACP methyl ester carboxylesterase